MKSSTTNIIAAAAGLTVGYLVFKPKVGAIGAVTKWVVKYWHGKSSDSSNAIYKPFTSKKAASDYIDTERRYHERNGKELWDFGNFYELMNAENFRTTVGKYVGTNIFDRQVTINKSDYSQATGTVKNISQQTITVDQGQGLKGKEFIFWFTIEDAAGRIHTGTIDNSAVGAGRTKKWWLQWDADVQKMNAKQFEERVLKNKLNDFDRQLWRSKENRKSAAAKSVLQLMDADYEYRDAINTTAQRHLHTWGEPLNIAKLEQELENYI